MLIIPGLLSCGNECGMFCVVSVVLPAPRIESNKVTDTSVAIFLPEMPTVEYMDEADR